MLLYIIRHGDPIYDPDCLTPLGLRQAEAVGRRLSQSGLDRIYCSPMIRAQQTAQPTCEMLQLQPQIEDWTAESHAWKDLSFVCPDGKRRWIFQIPHEAFNNEEVRVLGDRWYEHTVFDPVNAKAGYERIQSASDDFLARQGYRRDGLVYRVEKPNDDRIAVFCHQGFGLTWLSHLLRVPPPMFWASFDITYTSVTILRFDNNESGVTQPLCLCMGDVSHIYESRLPLTHNKSTHL